VAGGGGGGFALIGMGGITSAEDALQFILAGASAVAIGTGGLVDPSVFQRVLTGLEDYLVRKDIPRLADLCWPGSPQSHGRRSFKGEGKGNERCKEKTGKIIIPLDVPGEERALELVDLLLPLTPYFKVGLELFNHVGPAIVKKIRDRGGRSFWT
jgi:hypothetical protein